MKTVYQVEKEARNKFDAAMREADLVLSRDMREAHVRHSKSRDEALE